MMQEAFATALERWPAAGIPDNPRAWLVTTARHKTIDLLRRHEAAAAYEPDHIRRNPRAGMSRSAHGRESFVAATRPCASPRATTSPPRPCARVMGRDRPRLVGPVAAPEK